jgi:hypothetical protein
LCGTGRVIRLDGVIEPDFALGGTPLSCSDANESTAGPDLSNVPSPVFEEHGTVHRWGDRVAEIGEPSHECGELDVLRRPQLVRLTLIGHTSSLRRATDWQALSPSGLPLISGDSALPAACLRSELRSPKAPRQTPNP